MSGEEVGGVGRFKNSKDTMASKKAMQLRQELLKQCRELLESYKPSTTTPSTHVEEFVHERKIREENTVLFLREVMYGTQRYAKLLKVIVDGLYTRYPSQVNRLDRSLYIIMTYLTLFRISELTFSEYKKLVKSQEPHKMNVFLGFLFHPEFMKTWLRDQMLTIYDYTYVDGRLIGTPANKQGMHKFLPQIQGVLGELEMALRPGTSKSTMKGGTTGGKGTMTMVQTTKPIPFNLTQPKPRKPPQPEVVIQTSYQARPMPENLNQTSLGKIEELRKSRAAERRVKMRSKYQSAKEDPVLSRLEKQNEVSKLKKQALIQEQNQILEVTMKPHTDQKHVKQTRDYYKKVKNSSGPKFEIKPTAAAILREDAMYRKKQEHEAAIIRDFEVNLRDTSEYDSWKAREEAKEAKELEEMKKQRKELLTKASEIAKQAVEESEQLKKDAAAEMRDERQNVIEQLELERRLAIEENQARTVEVKKVRQMARDAVQQIEVEKKSRAAKMQAEMEELRKFREKEAEHEMKQKKDLIKEIQAMVAQALVKSKVPKEFDPTTTSGVGLLEEMSLVELRERLTDLKEKEIEEVKHKRGKLRVERDTKKEELALKLKRINRLRKQNAQTGEERRAKKQQSALEIAVALREKREKDVLHMYKKLESAREKKRADALRLAKDLKTRQIAKTFLDADAAKVEEQKWKQIQRGQGRQAEVAQALKQVKARKKRSIHGKEKAQRTLNATLASRRKHEFREAIDAKTQIGMRRIQKRINDEAMVNTLNARVTKMERGHRSRKIKESKPYETMLARSQLRDAREFTTTKRERTLARAGKTISSPQAIPS